MGWFDEQIRQRKLSDQEVFEESIFRISAWLRLSLENSAPAYWTTIGS